MIWPLDFTFVTELGRTGDVIFQVGPCESCDSDTARSVAVVHEVRYRKVISGRGYIKKTTDRKLGVCQHCLIGQYWRM